MGVQGWAISTSSSFPHYQNLTPHFLNSFSKTQPTSSHPMVMVVTQQHHVSMRVMVSKRDIFMATTFFPLFPSPLSSATPTQQQRQKDKGLTEGELERYTDAKERFTLLKPSSWIKVEKAGAAALFEDPVAKGDNIGVVVNPVRIASLKEFGSPQDVALKLIQAEKRKESTKDAQLIRVGEREGDGGLDVYEMEYKVDSTRGGLKRILSAAFVASRKLYLLNIAYSDSPENPLDPLTTSLLEQVLQSFDSLN
ncbi:hypothetical protein AMTRI_Chr11g156330 [Amborella trichopoda]|uniref:PsbP C-terminal domain-containing protein n=1 Tax=Amborella trichopoda TaxID=13333 RepID=W1PFJ8_AMBTC|nr:psbP domain-containing protein 2, chloroplastic [Amborella trichopoda]ERN08752.1 hypothetical protein AMTR_s00017p00245450 [Amborella trichopoda]|eukprot:XP_006847171.1 psbP domain-containing protein 2, chloroplastic [Amborella trichopoda]